MGQLAFDAVNSESFVINTFHEKKRKYCILIQIQREFRGLNIGLFRKWDRRASLENIRDFKHPI